MRPERGVFQEEGRIMSHVRMSNAGFDVRPERPEDAGVIRALGARAFGPGRFVRTAYRVREGVPPVAVLSLIAWSGDGLIGSIRFTSLRIGGRDGALLLGPLVVEEAWKGRGCGRALIAKGLAGAREAGYALVLLVGDLPYYEKSGFRAVPAGQIEFPGPVDPARIVAAELEPGALESFRGLVRGEAGAS